jgi:signal transduction histidine kinase
MDQITRRREPGADQMGSSLAEARSEREGSRFAVDHPPQPADASGRQGTRFGSLRARLIASHVVVLLLAMVLVLGISAVGLRRYERNAQIEEMEDLAVPLVVEARVLFGGADRPIGVRNRAQEQLLTYQAAEMETRILVVRPDGLVAFDSAQTDSLVGEVLFAYQTAVERLIEASGNRLRVARTVVEPPARSDDPFAGQIVVIAAGGRTLASQPVPQQGALLLVAPPRRQGLTGRFLPPLLVILAIALAVAAVAGYLLSRRIAAPVARLTVAADAMAAGDLEQRVAEEGPDELGRLVASFNAMSSQVAATHRSQRTLLADIAHELRTPLTSVQGYAQALRDGVLPSAADRQRALATIGSEADRMGRLIRQLLELARLESGQARLNRRDIPLRSYLERVRHRFGPEAERRGVAVIVAAAAEASVRADEERLDQILDNLIGNALRHTPPGGEIVLAATPVEPGALPGQAVGRRGPSRAGFGAERGRGGEGGRRVRITVRDSGSGIAPERLARIFDRFERGEDAAGRDGFGLGLAIVRELVLAHDGTIAVASRLGEGTTFTVELPAGGAVESA